MGNRFILKAFKETSLSGFDNSKIIFNPSIIRKPVLCSPYVFHMHSAIMLMVTTHNHEMITIFPLFIWQGIPLLLQTEQNTDARQTVPGPIWFLVGCWLWIRIYFLTGLSYGKGCVRLGSTPTLFSTPNLGCKKKIACSRMQRQREHRQDRQRTTPPFRCVVYDSH